MIYALTSHVILTLFLSVLTASLSIGVALSGVLPDRGFLNEHPV